MILGCCNPTLYSRNLAGHFLNVVSLSAFLLGFAALDLAAENVISTTGMDRNIQVVEGNSVTVELVAMPEKYQIEIGYALGLFTASEDSCFWCGPNKPHPYSWLTTSVICRKRTKFQVLFFTAKGDTLDVLDFVDVEPATYRVNIGQGRRPEPGFYILGYRYNGAVVDEFKIHIREPR